MAGRTLTREGYQNLQKELNRLINVELPNMEERLADLREDDNFEEPELYMALDEKDRLEGRIAELRHLLETATVLDEDPDPDTASPGDCVIVQDMENGDEIRFQLLDGAEVIHGRSGVSVESPIGKALLNKGIGDVISVKVPDGKVEYKIIGFE